LSTYVLFDDFLLPGADLPSLLSLLGGLRKIYMAITVDGLTFYMADQGFNLTSIAGDPRVYPTVTSWGALRKFMSVGGRERESEVDIDLDAQGWLVDAAGTTRIQVMELLQRYQLRDTVVGFYQWNDDAAEHYLIWSGYWKAFHNYRTVGGKPLVSARIGTKNTPIQEPMSDVILADTFPNAPSDSTGKMISRAYGIRETGLFSPDALASNPAVFLGHGARFVEGVVVDENLTTLQRRVRFTKNDGTAASKNITQAGLSLPYEKGDIWLWIPTAQAYAMVDRGSYTITNDVNETSILIDAAPVVFVALPVAGIGSRMHSAFNATAYVMLDDDPTNYLETTSTDYQISFNIPAYDLPNFTCAEVKVLIRVSNNSGALRDIDFGIWNDFNTGSGSWWGNAAKREDVVGMGGGGSIAYGYGPGPVGYVPGDALANVGQNSHAEFSQGRFIGRDSNNVETPLQAYFQVSSASKDGIRVYGIGLLAKGTLSLDKTQRIARTVRFEKIYDVHGRDTGKKRQIVEAQTIESPDIRSRQYGFLCNGQFQADDSAGTYQAPNVVIRKGASIAHHILNKIAGEPCNTVSGTLGNFTDAKLEEVTGEKYIDPDFGPESAVAVDEAIREIVARHPIRFHKEDETWHCFYDEMNPHSSRLYRSSADVVRISAKSHLVRDSLRVEEFDWDSIRNQATVNYGHTYGTNRALGSVTVSDALSQLLFGERVIPQPIDEPWITCDDLSSPGTNPAALFLARYYARVNARPRLTVTCRLSQAFYDLKRGHIVEFDTDMESVGIACPAYRNGFLDYAHYRTDASTSNQAMSETPILMPSGNITSSTVFAAQKQATGITVKVPGTGTYTTVSNGWWYWNGTAKVPFTNVTRSDGGNPLEVFKAAAGTYTVSWDTPVSTSWKKSLDMITGVTTGYDYFFGMDYENSTVQITGTGMARIPNVWKGRLFEAIEVTRKPGGEGDYPFVEAVLQEIM
jgi:hypothetical protein